MNGEIAANHRMAPPSVRNVSARQGAAIAFQHTRSPSTVAAQSSAATAAVLASRLNRNADNRQHQTEAEPEVGSVKDKIGRFAADSLAPPTSAPARSRGPSPSVSPSPEQIAARLAAGKAPARKQEPAVDAARIGAMRSHSRMQSQTRPPAPAHELRSPIPVRPSYTRHTAVERMLQDDISLPDDSDTAYESAPSVRSRSGSVRSRASSIRGQTPILQPPTITRASPVPSTDSKSSVPLRTTEPSQGSLKKPAPSHSQARASTPSIQSVSGRSRGSSSSAVNEIPGIDEEALSNAIVASSLASARASPATPAPPPPPRRRRAKSLLQLAPSPKGDLSRTPSPPKSMPRSLRGMPKAEEADAGRRHKVNLLHKHPHKHHEGDRKRWRREVTEKERKRYEGVWASNKGLHINPEASHLVGLERGPPLNDMVLNLVVREIWSRSRLAPAALEQVWDLVDHRRVGLLTKEEFVVGMWLIDQQLKGHKLPAAVPDSVWDSVRYVTGIKLTSIGSKG